MAASPNENNPVADLDLDDEPQQDPAWGWVTVAEIPILITGL